MLKKHYHILVLAGFVLLLFVVNTSQSHGATIVKKATKASIIKKFNWSKLLGIGVEIHFGQSVPNCHCCYGGICDIKVGAAAPYSGPVDDTKVGILADALLANDQAIIGIAANGDAYLIFNRRCSRPELQNTTLTLRTAPECDPDLQRLYGIAPMKAGNYQVIDNGQYKMIRMN